MKTLRLPIEPMTAESFAPYGELMEPKERPAEGRRFFPIDFRIQGRPTVDVIWQPLAGRRFRLLERHFAVTQAFVPLEGAPAVVAVAPPTDPDDPEAIPKPEAVRAFRIDPGKGYAYRIGTWHSLDRYLLGAPGASFVILNVDPNPTQVVDYAERFGVEFEIGPVLSRPEAASGG